MPNRIHNYSIPIDFELVKLRALALDRGHLKLATWGTKEELQRFVKDGFDKFRQPSCKSSQDDFVPPAGLTHDNGW